MLAGNLDSLNVTSLKVEDNSLNSSFRGVKLGVASLYSSISASLISSSSLPIFAGLVPSELPWFDISGVIPSLFLSDGESRGLVVL